MSGGFGVGDGKAKVFVQKEEVEKLMSGDASGRVAR